MSHKSVVLIIQEDYKPEDEEDDGATNAAENKPFFASSDGTSFHANSFLELNLSRPLLRACEKLGYAKPTPIQVSEPFPLNISFLVCYFPLYWICSVLYDVGSVHSAGFIGTWYMWKCHYWFGEGTFWFWVVGWKIVIVVVCIST